MRTWPEPAAFMRATAGRMALRVPKKLVSKMARISASLMSQMVASKP